MTKQLDTKGIVYNNWMYVEINISTSDSFCLIGSHTYVNSYIILVTSKNDINNTEEYISIYIQNMNKIWCRSPILLIIQNNKPSHVFVTCNYDMIYASPDSPNTDISISHLLKADNCMHTYVIPPSFMQFWLQNSLD